MTDDDHRVLSTLGEGGMGLVERCFEPGIGRVVARKTAKRTDQKGRDQLAYEARLMAYLDHPGVVPVYRLDEGGTPSYTMRELRGETLHDRLRRLHGKKQWLSLYEALNLFTRICETMANAHEKGVLHLDLKPSNIMLEPHGQVVVIDWGLSRFYDWGPYELYLDQAGEGAAFAKLREPEWDGGGTRPYMSLEQMSEPFDRLGPPADIFAAGVILYFLLTKRRPFKSVSTALEFIRQRRDHTPTAPHMLRADLPRGLGDLCRRMLRCDAKDRPQSFREVLDELQWLSEFASTGQVRTLGAGDVLFSEGDPAGSAFQILEGELQVWIIKDGKRRVLAHRGVGDVIGELAMLSGTPRSATLTATKPTWVREVTPQIVEDELDKVHPLLAKMVRSLSDRLVETVDAERDG